VGEPPRDVVERPDRLAGELDPGDPLREGANSHTPLAMVLIVVSKAATTYPASRPMAASTGSCPALCACSKVSPNPSAVRFSLAMTWAR